MVLDAPAVVVSHFGEDVRAVGERAVAVAERRIDAGVAEPDHIGAAITIEIAHDPEVLGAFEEVRDFAEINQALKEVAS